MGLQGKGMGLSEEMRWGGNRTFGMDWGFWGLDVGGGGGYVLLNTLSQNCFFHPLSFHHISSHSTGRGFSFFLPSLPAPMDKKAVVSFLAAIERALCGSGSMARIFV